MGERSKRFVERTINIGTRIKILTYGRDRYGRYVADVFFADIFLNELLMAKGMG
ncbi:MAG: thermonuclease family protein [Deltaproteobacteria bacterium]|nr:thermonuclease family protein [Deltaproteobacteria bacterium]